MSGLMSTGGSMFKETITAIIWNTTAENATIRLDYYRNETLIDSKYLSHRDAINKEFSFYFVSVSYSDLIWHINNKAKMVFNAGITDPYYGIKRYGDSLYDAKYDAYYNQHAFTAFLLKT